MLDIYLLIWEVVCFIIVFALMFYACQALDFSKVFKNNSTIQIKIIIVFVSAAVAFAIAMGLKSVLEIIGSFR